MEHVSHRSECLTANSSLSRPAVFRVLYSSPSPPNRRASLYWILPLVGALPHPAPISSHGIFSSQMPRCIILRTLHNYYGSDD